MTAARKTKGGPTEYDISIGQKVRLHRTLLGWSQEKLADALGVTFQQVQKYENGVNRIAAGRLFELAAVMGVPVASFFNDIGVAGLSDQPQAPLLQHNDMPADPLSNKETLELIRAYYAIPSPALRKQFVELAKSMAVNLSRATES